MQRVTLVFLLEPERILLAMKKRGFGAGKFNGVGGKVMPGERIESAAVREAQEEIGVTIDEVNLEKTAEITFSFETKPEQGIHCHVFVVRRWEGHPTESEEMAPQWFGLHAIPYERMWVDDCYWLPLVLAGKKLSASFHFTPDGSAILKKNIIELHT